MPLIATRGAASAQGFGEFAQQTAVNYIEDVFSTWLYTGNGATGQTITNNIDLSTKGGLTWIKVRETNGGEEDHRLYDTIRGAGNSLVSNRTVSTQNQGNSLTAFNNNGFTLGGGYLGTNGNGYKYASWTFREQPKFFDVVTYTGTGSSQTITHNLGSTPGCIITKSATDTERWSVYHRSLTAGNILDLSETSAEFTLSGLFSSVTSSSFTVGTNSRVNSTGQTFVAYIFAHDAGGFGLSGSDNVISCGSFTGTGSDLSVNLGYEPQWLLVKRASSGTENWAVYDNMRGMFVNYDDNILFPNTSGAEVQVSRIAPTATGFNVASGYPASGVTYIYIAIRRGPMKVPTDGTSVFAPIARSGTGGTATITAGFAPDLIWSKMRNSAQDDGGFDKLRGAFNLRKTSTGAEYAAANAVTVYTNTGVTVGADSDTGAINSSGSTYGNWIFQRAPSFMDVACYTGTGSATTFSHNLAAVPEMMIVKIRTPNAYNWYVYHNALGNDKYAELNLTRIPQTSTNVWNDLAPTASVFNLGTNAGVNESGSKFVNYLFATCAGVSKVGSYTGTGTTQTINCGFTAGSRFVMIKRTDSTGDWYVWDSARGIVAGNDPYLLLNSTAAEVTSTDYIDTYSAGFEISSTAPAAINASGGSFIFLAIS